MSIGSVSGTSASEVTASNPFASMTSGDFIKILITELTQQDPLNPQDSSKLLEQFSSLRNIESQLQLQDKLEDLVLQNQISSAGGLIGKMVRGLDDSNVNVTGQVTSVRVQNGKAYLELDTGKMLEMGRVTEIANSSTNAAAGV